MFNLRLFRSGLRPAPTWALLVVAVVSLVALIACVQLTAMQLVVNSRGANLAGADFVKAVNDARTSIAQIIGGFGLMGGLAYTARTYALSRGSQLGQRFQSAADQLSSDRESARISGIFSLQNIAFENRNYWPLVDQLLSAFVREQTRKPRDTPVDVSVALKVIGRKSPLRRAPIDVLKTIDLRDSKLHNADLSGLVLKDVRLDRAHLDGASLIDTQLSNATMSEVSAVRAQFINSRLDGVDFTSAALRQANFRQAVFRETEMNGADLCGVENVTTSQRQGMSGTPRNLPPAT